MLLKWLYMCILHWVTRLQRADLIKSVGLQGLREHARNALAVEHRAGCVAAIPGHTDQSMWLYTVYTYTFVNIRLYFMYIIQYVYIYLYIYTYINIYISNIT